MSLSTLPRIGLIAGVFLTATGIATSAYTVEPMMRTTSFICNNGEKISVEFKQDHVRLRNGSGVFALSHTNADGDSAYSDGSLIFINEGDHAQIGRIGAHTRSECHEEKLRS